MRLRRAFTIVELLTVVAIIAILVGLLVPSMNMARNFANEAKQRVQIATLDQAILLFRNENGDYPPAPPKDPMSGMPEVMGYTSSQILAEAMFGLDLLGCYQGTTWQGDILEYTSAPGNNLQTRFPRYLDMDTFDVVNVADYYYDFDISSLLVPESYVICDVFGHRKMDIGTQQQTVGLPVLYFKADPSKYEFSLGEMINSVYNLLDNFNLIQAQMMYEDAKETGREHLILTNFYNENYKLLDTRVTQIDSWPHRPDSYILISAGLDGEYGTNDDITNFGK